MRKTFLIALLVCLSMHTWALSAPEYERREADFKVTDVTGWSTSTLIWDETIELSDDHRAIVGMNSEAYLFVKTRSGLSETALEAKPGVGGTPQIRLWIRGDEKRNSDRHGKAIGDIIEDAALDFGLGAPTEMERLYTERGMPSALKRLSNIKSSSATAFVIKQFVALQEYTIDEYRLIVESTKVVPSSTDLANLLVYLTGYVPDDPALTTSLLIAAQEIKSSSDTAYAITEIASERGLDTESAIAMAHTAKGISSSSDTTFALSILASNMPKDETAYIAYFQAAESISSSSDRKHALSYIVTLPISEASELLYIRAASTIASSSERVAALTDLITERPISVSSAATYIEAVGSVPSSSDASYALNAFIESQSRNGRLTSDVVARTAAVIPFISSSSDKSSCLKTLSEHMPIDDITVTAYLDATKTVASNSDKEYALRSLLEKSELSPRHLDDVQRFVNAEIASKSTKENLTRQIGNLRE